jgi:competence protein ComEC
VRRFLCLLTIVASTVLVSAQPRPTKTLDIYVVDVEGGNATLVIAPSGESLLIDTGNGGAGAERDAGRIMDAAKDAGITEIDHLIITHWHGDHVGGLPELATRIPIRHFIDHGPPAQLNEATDTFLKTTYAGLYTKAKHTVAKPGDTIPMTGVGVRVITSAGQVIRTSLEGGGSPNPSCPSGPAPVKAIPDDDESVGSLITFGRFRALHLGDLTTDKEFELVCPTNRIGTVDLMLGLHHGQDTSNSVPLVHAVQPRAAIMNNGTRKGGWPQVMRTLYTSPRFEDVWQMHFSLLSGQEYTAPGLFIANGIDDQAGTMPVEPQPLPQPGPNAPPAPVHSGRAYWIKASAQTDGTFTVTNPRTGFSKVYGRDVRGTR